MSTNRMILFGGIAAFIIAGYLNYGSAIFGLAVFLFFVIGFAWSLRTRFNMWHSGRKRIAHELKYVGETVPPLCEKCGYDLRASPLRCPECGNATPAPPLSRTPMLSRCLDHAVVEARLRGHNYLGTEHLLLGLLNVVECTATQTLVGMGIDPEEIRADLSSKLDAGQREKLEVSR